MNFNKKILISIGIIVIFAFVGCSEPAQQTVAGQLTQEEAYDKAVSYYPEGVSLLYLETGKITDEVTQDGTVDQLCYLFEVTYGDKPVSGVAVGIDDGSIWFRDMYSDTLWFSEKFMGYPRRENENAPLTPNIDIREHSHKTEFYFTHIDSIPELSAKNEGVAIWYEDSQTLSIAVTKITGTVTGAPDGPVLRMEVCWEEGEPVLRSIEYQPAPVYSQPMQVLYSGEELSIDSERLLEIAVYFRNIISGAITLDASDPPTTDSGGTL